MFFVIDGIDGTGKTTQCRMLSDWLTSQGYKVQLCRDPGGTTLGDQLRSILLSPTTDICLRAETLLFMCSRAQLIHEVVQPALARDEIVICDRFISSNFAYQGFANGLTYQAIADLGRFSIDECMPTQTFILDIPIELSHQRRKTTLDRIEQRDDAYFQKVREGYLQLTIDDNNRYCLVDAQGSVEDVQQQLQKMIQPYLNRFTLKNAP
ncbi:MAG: dTMP kinase [Zavarzinella sp.]